MRFNQYLIEAKISQNKFYEKFPEAKDAPDFYKWYTEMEKDCRDFIKFLKGLPQGKFIYRGMRDKSDMGSSIPRSDRRPKDTSLAIHNELDSQLEDEFGWKPRSEGVFVSSGMDSASSYGTTYLFFPKGKYRYVWSQGIRDSYSELDDDKILRYYLEDKGVNNWQELYIKLYGPYGEINDKGRWFVQWVDFVGHKSIDRHFTSKEKDRDKALIDINKQIKKSGLDRVIEDKYTLYWSSDSFGDIDADSTWSLKYKVKDEVLSGNKDYKDVIQNIISDILDKRLKYKDTGIETTFKTSTELIFKCDKYYYVDGSDWSDKNYKKWMEWLIWEA